MRRVAGLVLGTVICFLFLQEAAATTAKRVAVCPLRVHSGEDLSYLRDGLLDVFTSRLQLENRVVALGKSHVLEALGGLDPSAAPLAALHDFMDRVGAEYLVYGSVTKLGESFSVDVRLLEVGVDAPVVFSAVARTLDNLMPEIESLLDQVRQRVTVDRSPLVALSPPLVGASEIGHVLDLSLQLDVEIQARGLAVGDVDGDGEREIVLADSNNVFVYRLADGALQLAAEFRGKGFEDVIHVDVGDVNGNGFAEIFVTSVRDGPRSFVLEWTDGDLGVVQDDLRYFLRILPSSDGPPRLVGQASSRGSWPFAGERYPLVHRDGRYETGEALPGTFSLYHSLPVDLDGDGEEETLTLDGEARLVAVGGDGDQLWRGGNSYGGSCVHLEYLPSRGEDVNEYLEIPVRMLSVSTGEGNRGQILLVRNRSAGMDNLFRKKKRYDDGELFGLDWTGQHLRRAWTHDGLAGCIVDWALGDVTRDGRDDLVVVSGAGGGGLLSKPHSSLHVLEARPR